MKRKKSPITFDPYTWLSVTDDTIQTGNLHVMARKRFPHYWPFVRGIQWFPGDTIENNDAERWCIFCCLLEQAVEQTADLSVIWDAMTPMLHYSIINLNQVIASKTGVADN